MVDLFFFFIYRNEEMNNTHLFTVFATFVENTTVLHSASFRKKNEMQIIATKL